MNKDIDSLLRSSLTPDFTPSEELNSKILRNAGSGKERKAAVQPLRLSWAKGLAAAACVIVIGSVGVYATTAIIEKINVTKHAVSVGNPSYVDDKAIATMDPTEPASPDAKNESRYFDSYEEACKATGMGLRFTKTYEIDGKVSYSITSLPGYKMRSLEVFFKYEGGTFYVSRDVSEGDIADDAAYSIRLEKTSNRRTYRSKTGVDYELVDGTSYEKEYTYVMISNKLEKGYIRFDGLNEKQIHEVLDSIDPESITKNQ